MTGLFAQKMFAHHLESWFALCAASVMHRTLCNCFISRISLVTKACMTYQNVFTFHKEVIVKQSFSLASNRLNLLLIGHVKVNCLKIHCDGRTVFRVISYGNGFLSTSKQNGIRGGWSHDACLDTSCELRKLIRLVTRHNILADSLKFIS